MVTTHLHMEEWVKINGIKILSIIYAYDTIFIADSDIAL